MYEGINHITPRKTVDSGISFAMPDTIYALIPTGGVIAPMVVTIVITTPNQIGS